MAMCIIKIAGAAIVDTGKAFFPPPDVRKPQ